MRPIVSRTTPGETSLCRGMSAVCCPQGQTQVVCGPVSGVRLMHRRFFSARSTCRRGISFAMSVKLRRSVGNGVGVEKVHTSVAEPRLIDRDLRRSPDLCGSRGGDSGACAAMAGCARTGDRLGTDGPVPDRYERAPPSPVSSRRETEFQQTGAITFSNAT